MLELEISSRHSKWPLIDDMVVASTMTSEADRGARSLAPHWSEAPYCKQCYYEIINSVGAKECYSTCKENPYWREAYWHYLIRQLCLQKTQKQWWVIMSKCLRSINKHNVLLHIVVHFIVLKTHGKIVKLSRM